MDGLEAAMEGAFSGLAGKLFSELQCETAVPSSGEHSQENSVDSLQKRRKASGHRSMEKYQN